MRRDAWHPTGPGGAPLGALDLDGGTASINQRQLRRHGLAGWQPATTAGLLTACELSPAPGVFFDVGANAGVYALLCRRLWPAMETVAFEPAPDIVAAGQRWARANDARVRFEPVAVSDAEQRGTLHLSQRSDACSSLVARAGEPADTLTVDLITLDGYVARTGLAPTVVKIDVERHEPAVLAGARATLARHQPVIVMEELGGRAARQAQRQLADLGYEPVDLGGRDCLHWPGDAPPDLTERLAVWEQAVARCTPTRASRWPRLRAAVGARTAGARTGEGPA